MKCDKHPTYQVLRPPRGKCITCWRLWFRKIGMSNTLKACDGPVD